MLKTPANLNDREWLSSGTGLMEKSRKQQHHGNCGCTQGGRQKRVFEGKMGRTQVVLS